MLILVCAALVMSILPVPLNVRAEHQAILERPTTRPPPTLPVANATQSFWLRSPGVSPVPTEGSDGELTSDADVCIIGSGITGVSAAYHLAQSFASREEDSETQTKPLKAVILEAREFCSGATGRNGGHLTAHAYRGFAWLEKLYGKEGALRGLAIERYTVSQILKILHETQSESQVDLVENGRTILLFTTEEHEAARQDYVAAKSAGIDLDGVEWLSKEEVEERYGASYPAVRIPGNNLWPLKLVSVLYNLAKNASDHLSVSIHTRTPVTSVTPAGADSPRRWILNTPRGPISCSYVLHATNAYASYLLPFMHGPDGIVPTRGQIIATRAETPSALNQSGFIANDGFEYWFPRAHKNSSENELIILGGGREASKDQGYEFYEVDDSVINPDVGKVLRQFLPVVFPGKFDNTSEPEMEWTGIMGYTKSREPFVGPVVNPNDKSTLAAYQGQYISAGYTGHGMPRAFACAEAVAGMIVADIYGEEWSVPDWFPKHYLTTKTT